MTRITGTIVIDFDTDRDVDKKTFNKFKENLEKYINDAEFIIYDIAGKCGFEVDSVHPLDLYDMEYENPELLEEK